MHHAPSLREPALEKLTAKQTRAADEQLGVADRNDDFTSKFYDQAHSSVNAYCFTQVDGFQCQATENGQCRVAPGKYSVSDSALHSTQEGCDSQCSEIV